MTRIAKFHESIPKTRRGKRTAALSDAHVAVAWLNEAKDTAAYRRIHAIYAHLDRLDGLLVGRLQAHSSNEWFVHQSAANELLGRYAFIPRVILDANKARRYLAVPRREGHPAIEVTDGHLTISVSEPLVAAALARLYATGELFHVHLCEHCRECWHARLRRLDRFCSRQHQLAFYTDSEEARERHRLAQKRHRKSSYFERS